MSIAATTAATWLIVPTALIICSTGIIPAKDPSVVWVFGVGIVTSFILAFGMGANDVANAFGTSVGSKAITIKTACIIATFCETAGAILVGYSVSETIRSDLIDTKLYDNMEELALGSLAALMGCAIWLIVASILKLPVSSTQSTVGATIGFSLVAKGGPSISWNEVGRIVGSWFISPVISGVISGATFYLVKKFILERKDPIKNGLISLPYLYGITIGINLMAIVLAGSTLLRFDKVPWWGGILIGLGVGVIAAILVQIFLVPHTRRKVAVITKSMNESGYNTEEKSHDGHEHGGHESDRKSEKELELTPQKEILETAHDAGKENGGYQVENETLPHVPEPVEVTTVATVTTNNTSEPNEKTKKAGIMSKLKTKSKTKKQMQAENDAADLARVPMDASDREDVNELFSVVQILTAACESFAHGGNDVSNAIGPLITIWVIYFNGYIPCESPVPWAVLLLGAAGIVVGLWFLGYRVMQTIGHDLTHISTASGFSTEFGAALAVMLASNLGIPISTTHCVVGSVVAVGFIRERKGVHWKLFGGIFFAWIVTLPIAGGLAAAIMAIFEATLLDSTGSSSTSMTTSSTDTLMQMLNATTMATMTI